VTFGDLFNLVSGGQIAVGTFLLACVLSVVFVVVKFLHYQAGQDVRLNEISERCHSTQTEIMNGYKDSLSAVIESHLAHSQAITDRLSSMEHSLSAVAASMNQMIGKMK